MLKATINIVISVCPPSRLSLWNAWVPTERIFVKFNICIFFENLSRKVKFRYNMTRITRTLHEEQHTVMTISPSVLLIMRYIWEKICPENRNTHFMFNKAFWFRKLCRLWDKVEKFSRAGRAKNDNTAHAHCMLVN